MDYGSLLEHALQSQQQNNENAKEANTIILDIYSIESRNDSRENLLLLAELATRSNQFLQSQDYLWHFGGDGPVFGVHVGTDGIVHLRAYCNYGPCVQDEWMAVDIMFRLSELLDHDVAISCWDIDDGQVILIQTADVLPDWLDEDPTDNHRNACFIRNGRLQIIQNPHLSLKDALQHLHEQPKAQPSSHPMIHNSILHWLEINRQHVHVQKCAFVIPRKIATLIRERPDLVHFAMQTFCKHIEDKPPSIQHHEDWVWTTHRISRTNYAMARTMVSQEWKSPELMPSLPVEAKRYKRQCNMEATPHLKHALELGVRLVVGFELLLQSSVDPTAREVKLAHWTRIAQEGNGSDSSSWILESYQRGPQHSNYDLSHILKCPVFPEDKDFPTLNSHPDVSIKQQILNAQKKVDPDEDFPKPLSDMVDTESWLVLESGSEGVIDSDFEGMISKFREFMVQSSGPEGVDSSNAAKTSSTTEIRPRVFMNILLSVLKGEGLSFPSVDPYFYQEDYDLMDQEEEEEGEATGEMKDLMDAMDAELKGKSNSRALDPISGLDIEGVQDGDDDELTEKAHVLNNLLQSLDASDGKAGPVSNMIQEMS
ncbi:unnamed protein product [Cylindrotheca closterium]|uniref:Uncharacterized protein n=1 Tax=Cylindrotheca closterium TaxID=2856 RepID=A0AAD2CQ62_9STRA|nr:unnamed protein product [Cylindrotheca closterium]